MPVDLMTEAWSWLWCEGDLNWKSVAVVLAKMPIWMPEQGRRILMWTSVSLASIQEKVWSRPARGCPAQASPQCIWYQRKNRAGGGTVYQKREELSEKRLWSWASPEPGWAEMLWVGVSGSVQRGSQETGKSGQSQSQSHCWVSRSCSFYHHGILIIFAMGFTAC